MITIIDSIFRISEKIDRDALIEAYRNTDKRAEVINDLFAKLHWNPEGWFSSTKHWMISAVIRKYVRDEKSQSLQAIKGEHLSLNSPDPENGVIIHRYNHPFVRHWESFLLIKSSGQIDYSEEKVRRLYDSINLEQYNEDAGYLHSYLKDYIQLRDEDDYNQSWMDTLPQHLLNFSAKYETVFSS